MRPLTHFSILKSMLSDSFRQASTTLMRRRGFSRDCGQFPSLKLRHGRSISTGFAAIAILLCGSLALAVPVSVTWTVDATHSSLGFAGNVPVAIFNQLVVEQAPNSLKTSFEGSIESEIEFGSSPTINILSSSLQAKNNGSWSPGVNGSFVAADANYGYDIKIDLTFPLQIHGNLQGALRGLVLNAASSGARSLSTTPFLPDTPLATFDDTAAPVSIISGTNDYRPFGSLVDLGLVPGTSSLVGTEGTYDIAAAKIASDGKTMTMTLPMFAKIQQDIGGGLVLNGSVFGTIVATAPAPAVPEPSTLVLLGIGASLIAARRVTKRINQRR